MTEVDSTSLQRLCRERAEECRTLAGRPELPARSRIMLEHLAGTWDRIAESLRAVDKSASPADLASNNNRG
jgi:hypothetical protein